MFFQGQSQTSKTILIHLLICSISRLRTPSFDCLLNTFPISGTCLLTQKCANTLISYIFLISVSVCSINGWQGIIPALFTTMLIKPCSFLTVSAKALISSRFVTLHLYEGRHMCVSKCNLYINNTILTYKRTPPHHKP